MAVYSSFQKCLNKDFRTFVMYCCVLSYDCHFHANKFYAVWKEQKLERE